MTLAIHKLKQSVPARLEVLAVTGSTAYGLKGPSSDIDLVGIHFMDNSDFLTHPEFRRNVEVVRKLYDGQCNEIYDNKSEVSLDSFEWWKFVSLWLKGSFVTFELLHFPNLLGVSTIPYFEETLKLMRENCPNRIGYAARGQVMHDWAKRRSDRKKAIIAYYRLLQSLKFLQTQEFEASIHQLKKWYGGTNQQLSGLTQILDVYSQPDKRKSQLDEKELQVASAEISDLLIEVDRNLISTKLPDRVDKGVLEQVLQNSQSIRMFLVES